MKVNHTSKKDECKIATAAQSDVVLVLKTMSTRCQED